MARPACTVGNDNDIPVNRVSVDRNGSKTGTRRDTVLDDIGIRVEVGLKGVMGSPGL